MRAEQDERVDLGQNGELGHVRADHDPVRLRAEVACRVGDDRAQCAAAGGESPCTGVENRPVASWLTVPIVTSAMGTGSPPGRPWGMPVAVCGRRRTSRVRARRLVAPSSLRSPTRPSG